jgi:SAM-dependent MidA family methyltransferase
MKDRTWVEKITFRDFVASWIGEFYRQQNPDDHFLTLPKISDIMAVSILAFIKSRDFSDFKFVELGAGDGELSEALIKYSQKFGMNISEAYLVEASSSRINSLKRRFQSCSVKVYISDEIPFLKEDLPTIVIANEFFDSLPFSVVLYSTKERALKELFVLRSSDGELFLLFDQPSPETKNFVEKYYKREIKLIETNYSDDFFFFEVSPAFEKVLNSVESSSILILCDYGYRFFGERRPQGSVNIHWKLSVEKIDFFDLRKLAEIVRSYFGKKDISFFVDFFVLEKIAQNFGFETNVLHLSSFIFSNLYESREYVEEILFSDKLPENERLKNILSFSDIMKGWGNFFVLIAEKNQKWHNLKTS